jgi:hypothetical protein
MDEFLEKDINIESFKARSLQNIVVILDPTWTFVFESLRE